MNSTLAPIQKIIDNDMCIACGACIEVCPEHVVLQSYSDKRGSREVCINDVSACISCAKPCGDVCPSILPFGKVGAPINPVGSIEEVYLGYSKSFQNNGVSSSGGIIREIVYDFLLRGKSVICILESEQSDYSLYEAGVMGEVQDLEAMPGSIYHSVDFSNGLQLLKSLPGPLLLVAIPCHLEGISRYIELHEPLLDDKLEIKLGIICGWMYSDHALTNFADAKKLEGPIFDAKYRGEDKVGRLKIRLEGKVSTFDRRKFANMKDLIAYSSSFSTDANRLRCRLCQNHINIQSDISVGDAWLASKGDLKLSIVVSRTSRGQSFIQRLSHNDRIDIETGSIADIEESQSKNLVYGYKAQKLALLLEEQGKPIIDYNFEREEVRINWKERLGFRIELFKRGLLRGERYGLYRFVYSLTRLRVLVAFLLKRYR